MVEAHGDDEGTKPEQVCPPVVRGTAPMKSLSAREPSVTGRTIVCRSTTTDDAAAARHRG